MGFELVTFKDSKKAETSEDSALSNEVDRVLTRLSGEGIVASSLLTLGISLVGGDDSQRRISVTQKLGELLPKNARPVVSFIPAKQLIGPPVQLQAVAIPIEKSRDLSTERFPEVAAVGQYFAGASSLFGTGSIIEQSAAALGSLRHGVEELGGSFADAVNLGVYFVDSGTREEWTEAALMRAASFTEPGPCATGIPLDSLADSGALIQFEIFGVIAARMSARIRDAWPEKPWEWPFRLPYRHGNRVGHVCVIGGQSSRGEDMAISTPSDIAAQTTMTIVKVESVLTELGGKLQDVVRLTAHYVVADDQSGSIVRERIIAAMPDVNYDLTLIGVHKLAHPEMLVEIDGVAVVDNVYTNLPIGRKLAS